MLSIEIDSFLNILIHVVAYHGRSKAPELIQTWFPHVVVATSLSPRFRPMEKESLAKLRILGQLHESLQTWLCSRTGWDAGSGRFDWSNIYVGWMSIR